MAALADDEKKQGNVDVKFNVKDLPAWSEQDMKSLDKESKELINHKCKYTLGKDGKDLVFLPSPHLYDKNGKYDCESDPMHSKKTSPSKNMIGINQACLQAAKCIDCDAVESTFVDQDIGFFSYSTTYFF